MLVFSASLVCFAMETILEFGIFLGFLYWAFPGFFSEGYIRINKMVDIVTNRMFDTFNRFSPRENHENSTATLSTLRRFSKDERYKRALTREAENRARDAQLFHIKENVPDIQIPQRRPFLGLSCDNCTIVSRELLVNKTTEKLALRNILDHQLSPSKDGYFQKLFSHLYHVYQFKKFPYPQVAEIVLQDDRLKNAIEKMTVQQFQDMDSNEDSVYQELLKRNQRRAKKLLYNMRSTLSDFLLRFTSWVVYKLLPCFITSVVVHPGQVEMVKKAAKSNLPLIFLPLHRSHLDYILTTFVLLNNNVRSPLVAAGDNLRIPFFGSLLRGLGAFYIKRRIDPIMGRKDHIYKALLHTYMNECLRAGHNMEFFLEGGRTRTGKPCMPKYGILSVIVDTFMDGTIEDAILVPVSINYEKLVDGNFVREQLGQPKEMESFWSAIRGIWKVLNSNYGMMRMDFNQPFSLRELVKTFNVNGKLPISDPNKRLLKSNPSTSSLYGTDVVSDDYKSLVETISRHIIYDCSQSTSIMSTNAVAFLLLTKFRNGATLEQLVNALNELRVELDIARKDIGFTGDSIDVINYGIELLGPGLIKRVKQNGECLIKPITDLPNVIELSYYSNTVVTHYSLESVAAIAICSSDFDAGVTPSALIESTLDLCQILQYEFIFCKPCQSLEQYVKYCIDDLANRRNIFKITENLSNPRIRLDIDDDDDEDELVEKCYLFNNTAEVKDHLNHLRGLVLPLIEAYAITAFTLDKLIGRQLLESEFLQATISEMKLLLDAKDSKHRVYYGESISVDAMKNALKLFQKWGYIECHSEKKLRLYYLKPEHDNQESVNRLYERIHHYRENLLA